MKNYLLLTCIYFIISPLLLKAQDPRIRDLEINVPTYFGGKAKMFTNSMLNVTFEKIRYDNVTITWSLGVSCPIISNEYNGTYWASKNDFGSFNASLPDSIPVNYTYKPHGIGVHAYIGLRHYSKDYKSSGIFYGGGIGFDEIIFRSITEKYDDYNYYPNHDHTPEAPYNNQGVSGYYTYWAGTLSIDAELGYNLFLSEKKLFYINCLIGYSPLGKFQAPLGPIYSRTIIFAPAFGLKFLIFK